MDVPEHARVKIWLQNVKGDIAFEDILPYGIQEIKNKNKEVTFLLFHVQLTFLYD